MHASYGGTGSCNARSRSEIMRLPYKVDCTPEPHGVPSSALIQAWPAPAYSTVGINAGIVRVHDVGCTMDDHGTPPPGRRGRDVTDGSDAAG